ncbi:protein GAPT [Phodopus roborovskii]|uniref:Gapt protein n=1 Tax=Phodopus roborovskii TaxID=109678 RepID=A0AAU9Z716_PHORO|nr:protein GAPT [Phodopus roborovskii]XP_051038894.1 protein GAPT [Phodopus roborovskii]XP_051038895.1 protein GAPT [Phodopus roborovskii]CAH6787640.1 Gapt [Phodopus roborovskii]
MLSSFASSSMGVAVGVSLLVLFLACGIGCVWHWKRREATAFTLPKFMQRRSSRHKDCTKTLGSSAHVVCPSSETSVESKGHKSSTKRNRMLGEYENVEVGPPDTEVAAEKALYENTQPSNLEEHVYGNQTEALYYNFQKPTPPAPQDDDTYILPDSY